MDQPVELSSNACRRALFTPELLDLIFTYLDRTTNVTNACVCKQWSDIALDHVWRNVDDLLQLFRILKSIKLSSIEERYEFTSTPGPDDWLRFEKYARRVRSLRFNSDEYEHLGDVLDGVARTRTSFDILPYMHTLEWITTEKLYLERCAMFLHSRLKHLVVSTHPAACRSTLFKDISARVPSIHSLKLDTPEYDASLEADIRTLLQNLPELRKFSLPEFYLTLPIFEELSRMKNISVIEFEHVLQFENTIPDATSFNPILAENAFPALWDLALTARIDHVGAFLRSPFAPINITSFYINSYDLHMPSEMHAFLLTLSQQCQLLSQLYVKLLHKETHMTTFVPEHQLSYDTIGPVLSFPNLTTFELIHKYPLKITLDEVDDLARRWPSLESLMLNAEPLFLDPDLCMLDLRALLPFARHCPNLRRLGLYVNATEAKMHASLSFDIRPFTALQDLSVGTSLAEDQHAVAGFLSMLVPPNCKLEVGITWINYGTDTFRTLDLVLDSVLSERGQAWLAISQLLPVLIEFRREDVEKSRGLHKEVEDLRMRNRQLMAKINDVRSNTSCVVA
ncbi:hypothetical protein F5I97DRAFT_1869635 [Phlebopus sp. FC_14]|nr:hypothetical protein F5I97DRAFT_1869635 [Phlebopus sp. FC_14]